MPKPSNGRHALGNCPLIGYFQLPRAVSDILLKYQLRNHICLPNFPKIVMIYHIHKGQCVPIYKVFAGQENEQMCFFYSRFTLSFINGRISSSMNNFDTRKSGSDKSVDETWSAGTAQKPSCMKFVFSAALIALSSFQKHPGRRRFLGSDIGEIFAFFAKHKYCSCAKLKIH